MRHVFFWLWIALGIHAAVAADLTFYTVYGVKEGDVLALRESPDAKARQVGMIPTGAQCVRHVSCEGEGAFRWCQVDYQGTTGWTAARFLQESTCPDKLFFTVMNVAPDDVLNMRSSPDAKASVVKRIPPNTRCVKNLGCVNVKKDEQWCKVEYEKQVGWVAGSFVMEERCEPTINRLQNNDLPALFFEVVRVKADDVLHIRALPDAKASKVGEIPPTGRCLRNLSCLMNTSGTRWCRVEYQGVIGWVAESFVQASRCEDLADVSVKTDFGVLSYRPDVFFSVQNVAVDDVLNIRAMPEAKASRLGSIPPNGQCIKNLGCAETKPGETWCRVEYQGVVGWTAGSFLTSGRCE